MTSKIEDGRHRVADRFPDQTTARALFLVSCFSVAGAGVTGCSNSHTMDLEDAAVADVGRAEDTRPVDSAVGIDALEATDGGADGGTTADAPRDSGATPDAPRAAGRISCGALECDTAIQGCLASCLYATGGTMPACVDLNADGTWPDGECPTGMEMFPRYWLVCDGADDCAPGEDCHLVFGSLGQYAQCAACPAPCDHRSFRVLCASDADCPSDAPRCVATADLPGYSTCEE